MNWDGVTAPIVAWGWGSDKYVLSVDMNNHHKPTFELFRKGRSEAAFARERPRNL